MKFKNHSKFWIYEQINVLKYKISNNQFVAKIKNRCLIFFVVNLSGQCCSHVVYAFLHTYVSFHIITCNSLIPISHSPTVYSFYLLLCTVGSERWQWATNVRQLNLCYSQSPRRASTLLLPGPLLLPSSFLPLGCICIQFPWATGISACKDPTTFYTLPNLGPDPSKPCGNKIFYKPVTGMV